MNGIRMRRRRPRNWNLRDEVAFLQESWRGTWDHELVFGGFEIECGAGEPCAVFAVFEVEIDGTARLCDFESESSLANLPGDR